MAEGVKRRYDSSRRQEQAQENRRRIVAAAQALFVDKGYGRTTIADIAEAAEISPRTFFSYFPSKEAVVFHNFDAILESIQASIVDRPDGQKDDRQRAPEDEHGEDQAPDDVRSHLACHFLDSVL